MRAEADGATWGWQYDLDDESPEIWVVRNISTGAVLYVHESENRQSESTSSPIISTQIGIDGTSQSILPENSEIKKIIIPMDQVVDDIELIVEETTLPSWIIYTDMAWVPDSKTWLAFLFQQMQKKRSIHNFSNISDVFATEMDLTRSMLYTILWLRCASSIIYDHIDQETCIPLIINKFIVNSAGIVTV